ncbi:hypothetical protein [Streptococcus merionis]|uniref:hypothetical protein n=1 Tax=Streptococcus merionis TaxID=400065 RepID=UPI0026E9A204|nr:hypothetical protein [Streptococcus merionis]
MTFDVNKEEMTIMGVKFDNYEDFNAVWYAVGSSMIENYQPTVQEIETFKTHISERRKELKVG